MADVIWSFAIVIQRPRPDQLSPSAGFLWALWGKPKAHVKSNYQLTHATESKIQTSQLNPATPLREKSCNALHMSLQPPAKPSWHQRHHAAAELPRTLWSREGRSSGPAKDCALLQETGVNLIPHWPPLTINSYWTLLFCPNILSHLSGNCSEIALVTFDLSLICGCPCDPVRI